MPTKKSRQSRARVDSVNAGFSLLELTVVVVVLGILSSVTLPRIGSFLAFADVDTAKALLNTAAADCLQNSRLNTDDKDEIDDTIISDTRVNPIGFKIDKDNSADKCSYFQLTPTDEEDNIRFPIGFSVSDGALSKFANPTSTDKGSINSCETWAGVNCKQDESLKKLVEWKNQIAANKATCEENYTKWLTEDNTTPFQFQRWNPNAESGCPSRPPKDGSESYKTPTCTTNGCNRDVFGLDGEFVGFTKEDYDRALEEKYGAACREWVAAKEQAGFTNNTTSLEPERKLPECGAQEFWFFEGEDQGTKEKFMETACNAWIDDKASENPPYTNDPTTEPVTTAVCGDRQLWFVDGVDYKNQAAFDARLLEKASEKCLADLEEARQSGFEGKWGPKEGPGACMEETYICNKKVMDEFDYYHTCDSAKAPNQCKGLLREEDPECTEYELNDYWFRKCGGRPKRTPPDNCRFVGTGKPYDSEGWDKNIECSEWAKCMQLY